MVNNNGIPIEVNKKLFETVYEIKNENEYKTPSFEEFMKTYENDGNLSYDDLNGSDIRIQKGYGPCKRDGCNCSCNREDFSCRCRWGIETWIDENGTGEYRQGVFKSSGNVKISLLDSNGELRPNANLEISNHSLSAIRKKESGGGES